MVCKTESLLTHTLVGIEYKLFILGKSLAYTVQWFCRSRKSVSIVAYIQRVAICQF